MDSILGYLIDGLYERNLLENLNIVIVSDHGMASLEDNYQIPLEKYIDINAINLNKTVFATVSNIYPKSNSDVSLKVNCLFNFN
jgi:predicted AlkP superfamily pyrophosphatase or phosphodiesterase